MAQLRAVLMFEMADLDEGCGWDGDKTAPRAKAWI